MMKIARQQQVMAGTIAAAAVGLWVVVAFVVRPLLRQTIKLSRDVKQRKADLRATNEAIGAIPKLRQEFEQLEQVIAQMRTSLPTDRDVAMIMSTLSDAANQTNLRIVALTPIREDSKSRAKAADDAKKSESKKRSSKKGKAAEPKPVEDTTLVGSKEIPLQIDALGGFHQLGMFLSRVELGPQPIEVKSLRISKGGDDPRRHQIRLVLGAYVTLAEPLQLPGASAAKPAKP